MNTSINKVKALSIWIFLVPFIAVNVCLYITTNLHFLIDQPYRLFNTFPYLDGGTSISRTARYFPNYLIFKPAMFLTSYLLIKYWLLNKEIINSFKQNHKFIKKFVFFGVASAISLILHSIFLGISFDFAIYKLFRRVVMLSFIIFEVAAQTYLVLSLYSIKDKISHLIKPKILKLKIILVSSLVVVGFISIPIVTLPGNKFLKHALEWDYFLGVIIFYFLTFLMWKKNK